MSTPRYICRWTYSDLNSAGILSGESSFCWCWCPPLGERSFLLARSCDIELSQAAKGVSESLDILVDIFGRIESFFVRLEMYTGVSLTLAMTNKMVQITVEILDVLAIATKEMGQSRASESNLRHMLLEVNIGPRNISQEGGRADGPGGWVEEARNIDQ